MSFREPAEVIASAARTATGQSAALTTPVGTNLALFVDVTVVSGTTPTLDLTLEWSTDGGTTWFVVDTADSFVQIIVAKKVSKLFMPKAATYRVKWTIAGTIPSFTFSVSACGA